MTRRAKRDYPVSELAARYGGTVERWRECGCKRVAIWWKDDVHADLVASGGSIVETASL